MATRRRWRTCDRSSRRLRLRGSHAGVVGSGPCGSSRPWSAPRSPGNRRPSWPGRWAGDLEETTDLLAALDADGWLSAWERPSRVVVTLSVGAASRLGVRLVESGRDEVPRWARPGEPEPPSPRASGVFRDERAARLELVVDPSPRPEEAAERAEEATAGRRSRGPPARVPSKFPVPTLLVGLGL